MIGLHRGSNEFGVHVNRVVNGVLVVIVGKLNGGFVVV